MSIKPKLDSLFHIRSDSPAHDEIKRMVWHVKSKYHRDSDTHILAELVEDFSEDIQELRHECKKLHEQIIEMEQNGGP